ncbi:tumor susceptibility gene 101 protein isoform X1 [Pleurodeles waltl]|uniref:tumor susceptibility gene 101 protein isoform X1 n=1 Tax=Pleurodeles waltl TaxID=8319 RepID=UPI0037098BDB
MAVSESQLKKMLTKYKYRDLTVREITGVTTLYKDLKPIMDGYVFNDGSSRELASLVGTIPVPYKGNTYNIPVCLWILDTYPFNPPICFVKPTSTMTIKTGKHVDANGKIYLPYLHEWKHPQSDLLGLIQIMIVVFGEEPPVFSRAAAPPTSYQATGPPNNVPAPHAAETETGRNGESLPRSEVDNIVSITPAQPRRRATEKPLPESNLEPDDLTEDALTPPSEDIRTHRRQSLFQHQYTPLRRRRADVRLSLKEGEGPSMFGGLKASMLKVQRLQCKHMKSMHRQLVSLNRNMCQLNATVCEGQKAAADNLREMTNAIKELCTVMQQDHFTHRRRHHQLMGRFDGFSRSVHHLTNATALLSQRAVGMQVEMAPCSEDVPQGLVQVTNALENMQAARMAGNSDIGGGDSEEVSNLSTVTASVMECRSPSSRHSAVSEASTRDATEPTDHSS